MSQVKENSVQLQIGEYYLNRSGDVRGPIRDADSSFPFSDGRITYAADGNWNVSTNEHKWDLIEHIPLGDPRHPNFTPASKIPGMALQHAVVIELTQEELDLLNLFSAKKAITEKEAAACIEVYPWPTEPLPSEADSPSLAIHAGRWLTSYGYVITLDYKLQATHGCPGVNLWEENFGGEDVGWLWNKDGTITGLTPEWTGKLRIVGPAPELPEVPDGFTHKSPPEYRVPRCGESYVGKHLLGGIQRSSFSSIKTDRWIIEPIKPEVVSIPIQTEREWLGNDKPAGEVQADEWPGERWGLVECETTLQDLYCVTLDVSAMDDVM